MLRKSTVLALVASILTATPAVAADHTIMMMGDGFFPDVVYLEDGDRVVFVNATDTTQEASAADGSWTTGPVSVDGQAAVPIIVGMHQVFLANGVAEVPGTVFFGETPLGD